MQTPQEYIIYFMNLIRCIPHIIVFYLHKNKSLIQADIKNGFDLMEWDTKYKQPFDLIYLLAFSRHYRNLFYYRIRPFSYLLNMFCPQLRDLEIDTKNIGEGFAIIHGYATAIGAKKIGKNCTVYQQVTIGGTTHGAPVLLDNVTVWAGAIVIGNITIGNNVVIGANATVYRDVPDNCTVLPGTSKVMKWKARDK